MKSTLDDRSWSPARRRRRPQPRRCHRAVRPRRRPRPAPRRPTTRCRASRSEAATTLPDRSVTVSGHGTVEVTPDTAHVSMGVQVEPARTPTRSSPALRDGLDRARRHADGPRGRRGGHPDERAQPVPDLRRRQPDHRLPGLGQRRRHRPRHRPGRRDPRRRAGLRRPGAHARRHLVLLRRPGGRARRRPARRPIDNARVRAGQYADAADAEVGEICASSSRRCRRRSSPVTSPSPQPPRPPTPSPVQPGSQELSRRRLGRLRADVSAVRRNRSLRGGSTDRRDRAVSRSPH